MVGADFRVRGNRAMCSRNGGYRGVKQIAARIRRTQMHVANEVNMCPTKAMVTLRDRMAGEDLVNLPVNECVV